jgi:hypothetical protein
MFNLTPAVRKFIYGLVAIAVPLLVAYGAFSEQVGVQLLDAVAAILAIGSSALAFRNVPPQD